MRRSLRVLDVLMWIMVADLTGRGLLALLFWTAPGQLLQIWPAVHGILDSVTAFQVTLPFLLLPPMIYFALRFRRHPEAALAFVAGFFIMHGGLVAVSVMNSPTYSDHWGHYLFLVEAASVMLLARYTLESRSGPASQARKGKGD